MKIKIERTVKVKPEPNMEMNLDGKPPKKKMNKYLKGVLISVYTICGIVGLFIWWAVSSYEEPKEIPAKTEAVTPSTDVTKKEAKTEFEQKQEENKKIEAKAAEDVKKMTNWEDELDLMTGAQATPTKQYDWAMATAKQFPVTDATQLYTYLQEIVGTVADGSYISQPMDAKETMRKMYKAAVIINASKEGSPAHEFAFDYLQNVKYVFRGVDAPDSQAVKANEEQMKKSLIQLTQVVESVKNQ